MSSRSPAIPVIAALAANSAAAKYKWKDRGRAPRGYIKGMAVMFGRVYCKLRAGDPAALDMAKPDHGDPGRDALAHYRREFNHLAMHNQGAREDTLRHLFVLLTGLGMRESSGHYGEGRDMSAHYSTASSAEAGLFQGSYGLHVYSPLLVRLFNQYRGSRDMLDIFKEGVAAPSKANYQSWGKGIGAEFQKLCKDCPAFAVEFTAVALRHHRREWGPINRKHVELRREVDALFRSVQRLIDFGRFAAL